MTESVPVSVSVPVGTQNEEQSRMGEDRNPIGKSLAQFAKTKKPPPRVDFENARNVFLRRELLLWRPLLRDSSAVRGFRANEEG
jgi:hypothetical protein